ncbi:hypothetical protein [Verrucosispora sp. WMMD573]|uniref:hypothetical protein n=1 Tax=Verrucosispora sp. WMMD573 TaxID=3015149 RepID=UPI00248CBFE5|nr:hypothetical protein [Verrucosispora sp. WMMD573]WBB55860.1 hypothetical protein O7601_07225 [Verrucosispora sp. WMMD573]
MTTRTSRAIAATVLAGAVTAASLLTGATAAQAEPVTAGTFTMSGDPGDWVTGGATYSYDAGAGDQLSIRADDQLRGVYLSINGRNGDWWSMELRAPAGQQLAVGEYPEATRAPFSGAGAGIDISGNGRGCNTITGSFVVADVAFGPHGYVERLDATFEQHCEGGTPALRGRVVIGNPPPPAPLEFTVTPAADGVFSKLNGKATVHGTVVCNADATVQLSGLVTQVKNKVIIRGPFSGQVDCVQGATAQWSATADPTGTTPFQRGKVEVTGSAWANDPNYQGETVQVDLAPTTVTLTRAPAAVEAAM